MNNKEDLKRLLDYYLYSDLTDEAELNNYLSEAEIDHENVANHISDLLRQKRAELLLQNGRKFKERYIQLKDEKYIENSERNIIDSNNVSLALAYRKKTDSNDETDDTEAQKLEMIRKAKGQKSS